MPLTPTKKASRGYPHPYLNLDGFTELNIKEKSRRVTHNNGDDEASYSNDNNSQMSKNSGDSTFSKSNDSAASQASSTTGHIEYPVFADGRIYNYDVKRPKDDPGHIRATTNQNKRLKGVIAHLGVSQNPNVGGMHWCEKEAPCQQVKGKTKWYGDLIEREWCCSPIYNGVGHRENHCLDLRQC